MIFKSKIFILPGLGNSGEQHWQTRWEEKFPDFTRLGQKNWDNPVCEDWITTIDAVLQPYPLHNVILVGHSLACCTIAYWSQRYNRKIKGALLVAPSDTEAESYPAGTTGFVPMCLVQLPFRSITVISTNDPYVSIERARKFAGAWGSELVNIGKAGHINASSSLGEWSFGLQLLERLDNG